MRQEQSELLVSQKDYEQLSRLVSASETESAILLEEELERAKVVPPSEIPQDTVTMNSRVTFVDLESGKESEVTLVYPKDANVDERKVSVLVPVGSALIGMRVGQEIDWPMPNDKKLKIKVIRVSYQPEEEGEAE